MKFGRKTQKNLFLEQDSLRGQDSVYQPCNFALQWKWKQEFNQDLLVRWTEPTENKKSGNKKQEDDQETAKRPKQDQTDSKAHRLSKT